MNIDVISIVIRYRESRGGSSRRVLVVAEESMEEREKTRKFKRAPIKIMRTDPERLQDDDHNDGNRRQKSRRTRYHARWQQ